MRDEERWAVKVDGINIPGFMSKREAEAAIEKNSEWRVRGAVAVRLIREEEVLRNLKGILKE